MKFHDFLNLINIKNLNKDCFEDWNLSKREQEIIDKIKSSNKSIVIWGASEGGKKVLEFIRKIGKEPDYFVDIDKNKQGKIFEGLKIFPPSKVSNKNLVIIGSILQDEIARYLEKMGIKYIKNIFSILDCNLVKHNFSILNNHLEELKDVFKLLSDEESKMVFSSYIKYILTTSPLYIRRAKYKQYFHPLVKPEKDDIVVDAGAFNGDTACEFLTYEPNLKKIYSFEPDEKNYAKLVTNCQEKKVVPVKKGLWSKCEQLTFHHGLNGHSHINKEKKDLKKISTISLDIFFNNKKLPDLIKMDIEGSELEALKGTKEIITRKKPKLQICLYHDPLHLFKIPLFLKSINLSYNFFLGHHTGTLVELVLYAI